MTGEPNPARSEGSLQLHASLHALYDASWEARQHLRRGNEVLERYLDQWQAYTEGSERALSPGALALKRAFDLAITTPLVILLSPLMAMIAMAVKLDSRGQVFFRQRRVGRDDRVFEIYKFRTMFNGADAEREALSHRNEAGGGLFKIEDDPRITRVGRFLRRTSLDELPQLLNVLRGELSLVGPRPLMREGFNTEGADSYAPLTPPGITGIWSLAGAPRVPVVELEVMDRSYIERWSLWLDLRILFLSLAPEAIRRRSSLARQLAAKSWVAAQSFALAYQSQLPAVEQLADRELDSGLFTKALSRAGHGDRDALKFVMARYLPEIECYLYSFVHDRDQAAELTAEVFVRLPRLIERYQIHQQEERSVPFNAWILRVTRNVALDHLRSQRHIKNDQIASGSLDRGEYEFRAAIEHLPVDQREVLVLRHVLGLSDFEVAEALDRSERWVQDMQLRARRLLNERIREDERAIDELIE